LIQSILTSTTKGLCMVPLRLAQESQSSANTWNTTNHQRTILRTKEEEEIEAVPKHIIKFNWWKKNTRITMKPRRPRVNKMLTVWKDTVICLPLEDWERWKSNKKHWRWTSKEALMLNHIRTSRWKMHRNQWSPKRIRLWSTKISFSRF